MKSQPKPDVSLAIRTAVNLATMNPNGRHVEGAQLRMLRDALLAQRSAITAALEAFKRSGDLSAMNEVQRFL